MSFVDRISRSVRAIDLRAPFTQFYRSVVLKMNLHEEELRTAETNDQTKRVIFLNRAQPIQFASNSVSTGKYSVLSFLPSFLFEQFRRYSNCFFLLIALLQQIPDVSPTGRWTTLFPLILILVVSAAKEIVEDYKRHRADDETNKRSVLVLKEQQWVPKRWDQLKVGDICRVLNNQWFPADLVLLASSEPQGICFIETSNLDGETNLKLRQASPATARLVSVEQLRDFKGTMVTEPPNRNLYEFNGSLKERHLGPKPLSLEQMLLRGAMLRNTAWIHGLTTYTGHETKLMKNSTRAPLKRSTVDRQTNTQIVMLFLILVVLALLSAVFSLLWTQRRQQNDWYLGLEVSNTRFGYNFLTFLILYNNLIPISLQVTAEIVRYFQAQFISLDASMYDPKTNTPAAARTSNLNEELGMVKYIFTDKTGTLTCNVMVFKSCSIADRVYEAAAEASPLLADLTEGESKPLRQLIDQFLTALAITHTVIAEEVEVGGGIEYHAASPDERALVIGARSYGYEFVRRSPGAMRVRARGAERDFQLLDVIDFTSTRKRMSVIVRMPNGSIRLYCKGADSVIYQRLAKESEYSESTLLHLEHFAREGLRTLVFAYTDVTDEFYERWTEIHNSACVSLENREEKIEAAAELIEKDLKLLGATGIEDKLQDGVPETIRTLLRANMVIWVLTGDKQETAINIAHSASLIHPGMAVLRLSTDGLDDTRAEIGRLWASAEEEGAVGPSEARSLALVVEGQALAHAATCELRDAFLRLCLACRVVVCCRVSPLQKAEVVELVACRTGAVTLAIGDGANDVAMIRRAAVGVGISGLEGLQAVCASDYSIAQFRFLLRLLLVHGSWNYSRISKLTLYSFYKNICLYVIELWFAIFSAWSGQVLFERWSIGLYNVIFTALPPFAIGIFDKFCSADVMIRYPMLYVTSQQGLLFNVRVFWAWVVNGLLHSLVTFALPVLLAKHDVLWPHGKVSSYLCLGNFVYTYVVVTVCVKSGLATTSWTWITYFSIFSSIIVWFLFLYVYSKVFPVLPLAPEMSGMALMVFSSPAFWVGLLLVPLLALLPDLLVTVISNSLFKSMPEAVKEIVQQEGEEADRRPTLTETARLLQNVRSVFGRRPTAHAQMDLEMSHGYAFSQEEGASVTQGELMRAYETSGRELS